ncbi:UPF0764 protein C16orf89 [Plecturocebus cupreus]
MHQCNFSSQNQYCFFLRVGGQGTESHSVAQAGVQRHDLGSLQPPSPGFKLFSSLSLQKTHVYQAGLKLLTSGDQPCLGLPKCWAYSLQSSWDYRHVPPCPANSVFLVETGFRHVGQAGLKLLISDDPPT